MSASAIAGCVLNYTCLRFILILLWNSQTHKTHRQTHLKSHLKSAIANQVLERCQFNLKLSKSKNMFVFTFLQVILW